MLSSGCIRREDRDNHKLEPRLYVSEDNMNLLSVSRFRRVANEAGIEKISDKEREAAWLLISDGELTCGRLYCRGD